jgi:tetratricopeptide (TPR) repeat protein
LAIIDEYGMTKTANLAKAYAGICYKAIGDYETAISYLKKFDADDMALSPALKGAIGDCYLELGEKEKAISFFQKAIASNNDVISPIYLQRTGLVYLSMGDNKKAVSAFEEIKNKYASSQLAADIDKYIQMATLKQN